MLRMVTMCKRRRLQTIVSACNGLHLTLPYCSCMLHLLGLERLHVRLWMDEFMLHCQQ